MKLIVPLAIIMLGGVVALSYVFRGTEDSVKNETATFKVSADDLYTAFDENESLANGAYLGKVIEVTGEVSDIEKTTSGQVVLILSCSSPMGGIRCSFESRQEHILQIITQGTRHTIKGKCAGKLMEVVLDNCYLTN